MGRDQRPTRSLSRRSINKTLKTQGSGHGKRSFGICRQSMIQTHFLSSWLVGVINRRYRGTREIRSLEECDLRLILLCFEGNWKLKFFRCQALHWTSQQKPFEGCFDRLKLNGARNLLPTTNKGSRFIDPRKARTTGKLNWGLIKQIIRQNISGERVSSSNWVFKEFHSQPQV